MPEAKNWREPVRTTLRFAASAPTERCAALLLIASTPIERPSGAKRSDYTDASSTVSIGRIE